MFLTRMNPDDVDPSHLVNREADLRWAVGLLEAHLLAHDSTGRSRLAFCVLGEKGVGKTLFTRRVLHEARRQFSDRAIFVEADCRRMRDVRRIIGVIAQEIVLSLVEMKQHGERVSNELVATAQVLSALTRFDETELKNAHAHVEQFKAAAKLGGSQALLKVLAADFQISVERSSSSISEMTGKVRFDEDRLCSALRALFEDIRESGLQVVLYLDNMDEAHHHYLTDDERRRARRDTNALLRLHDAPIVMILNMRTYYSGVLPREIARVRVLKRLPPAELLRILDARIAEEPPAVKMRLQDSEVRAAVERLAHIAPTPLAFLKWILVLFENEALTQAHLRRGVEEYLEAHFSSEPTQVWWRVVAAFTTPDSAVTRETLLEACDRNEAVLRQVVERQGVLPKDFWDPGTYFTLDPELYLLHPSHGLSAAEPAK
jgi:Cdc6-like AAA superfamily ATPase